MLAVVTEEFEITEEEQKFIEAYRLAKENIQEAIRKILEIRG